MKPAKLFVLTVLLLISAAGNGMNNYLKFVENKGQWEQPFGFRAYISSGAVFVSEKGLVYNLIDDHILHQIHDEGMPVSYDTLVMKHHAFKFELVNSKPAADVIKRYRFNSHSNFFVSNDRSRWKSNVLAYAEMQYVNVYNQVDFKVTSSQGNLKYDFVVKPGGNVDDIVLNYQGLNELTSWKLQYEQYKRRNPWFIN